MQFRTVLAASLFAFGPQEFFRTRLALVIHRVIIIALDVGIVPLMSNSPRSTISQRIRDSP